MTTKFKGKSENYSIKENNNRAMKFKRAGYLKGTVLKDIGLNFEVSTSQLILPVGLSHCLLCT
jgi:hypothetical protein